LVEPARLIEFLTQNEDCPERLQHVADLAPGWQAQATRTSSGNENGLDLPASQAKDL
jgi:hypothetical protein